jgi:hypothetical protein
VNNKELKERILLISLKHILDNIALSKIVYILYLSEYRNRLRRWRLIKLNLLSEL